MGVELKKAKRKSSSKTDIAMRKMAKTEFKPVALDLSKGMTNDELGKWMMPVRVAALNLGMTKAELVEFVRKLGADGKHESIFEIFDYIQEAKKTFDGLAEICQAASARILVAASAVGVEEDRSSRR